MKDYFADDISGPMMRSSHDAAQIFGPLVWEQKAPGHPPASNINAKHSQPKQPGRQKTLKSTWYQGAGKRAMDILFVIATLPISVPVILACVIVLWFEGGTPFYKQDRLGKGGKRFSILKLRTMVCDADTLLEQCLDRDPALRDEWETTQKLKNDPRITRAGALLRATSLDELPQLWNVLKGEMSLVGPRPMLPEQLSLYGDAKSYFALRPGITGTWQVSARNESRFSFRAELDAKYLRSLSLAHDLGLLLKTVGVVMRRTGY